MKVVVLGCMLGLVTLLCVPGPARAQSAQDAPPASAPRPPGTLPATIPLFPLADVVLFPNVSRPLLIFEPRYREMIADALTGTRIIGMVALRPGFEANYEGRPPIYAIGCAGEIAEARLLEDGRYTIVLRGLVKFRVTSEDQSRAYRIASVEALPERLRNEDREALRVGRERLVAMLALSLGPGAELPPAELADEDVVNAFAQYLELDPAARLELLEIKGALLRSKALIDLLEQR